MFDLQFWSSRKVLLTGHTGFKGGWLAHWLTQLGADVTGIGLPPENDPSLFELTDVASTVDSHFADITQTSLVADIVSACQPEVIFHLAAQPLVRRSYDEPIETYRTNVMGTANVLDAARKLACCRAIVNVTTDKCYQNNEWVWGYREDDRLGGYDPYSNSKACSELVTAAYRQSYFDPANYDQHRCAVGSARAGNVVGGGDWSVDRLLPDIIRAFERGEPVDIRNPSATRPWQHVLEPLSGYILLAQRLGTGDGDYAEGWNFGPNEESNRDVGWIVETATRLWGNGATSNVAPEVDAPHEATFLHLDCSKAKSRLGWKPVWNIEETLQRVIDWHQQYKQGTNMKDWTLQEIKAYENAVRQQSI